VLLVEVQLPTDVVQVGRINLASLVSVSRRHTKRAADIDARNRSYTGRSILHSLEETGPHCSRSL
jgi:hypothetical protein